MKNITFKAFKASEIEFVNKHDNGTRIEFENKYSYNVKYSPNNTCIGEFTVEVNDKANKEKFHIKAVVLGIFTYNPETKKKSFMLNHLRSCSPMSGQ